MNQIFGPQQPKTNFELFKIYIIRPEPLKNENCANNYQKYFL